MVNVSPPQFHEPTLIVCANLSRGVFTLLSAVSSQPVALSEERVLGAEPEREDATEEEEAPPSIDNVFSSSIFLY